MYQKIQTIMSLLRYSSLFQQQPKIRQSLLSGLLICSLEEQALVARQPSTNNHTYYSTSTLYPCHDDTSPTSATDETNPLYALVKMMTKLKHKRTTANEMYVRRVLQEQIGLSEYDLDRICNSCYNNTPPGHGDKNMAENNNADRRGVLRLSVRHDIEPVVYYLRSIGITGSALVDLIVQKPLILGRSVEHVLIPLLDTLHRAMDDGYDTSSTSSNNRAPAVLLKCPRLAVEVEVDQVQGAIDAIGALDGGDGLMRVFLWEFPDEFCDVAALIHSSTAYDDIDGVVREVVDILMGYQRDIGYRVVVGQQQQEVLEENSSSSNSSSLSSSKWRETKRMLRERIHEKSLLNVKRN